MNTLAVTNRKGGTGKTTTAVNLAACLAELGQDVLVIDVDPQANATTSFGAAPAADDEGTLALLQTDRSVSDVSIESSMPRVTLVPAGPMLAVAELEMSTRPEWRTLLRDKLVAGPHDCIILDTPPAMGVLAINALTAAHDVIVPLQCDYFSLEGLREFAANLNQLRLKVNPDLKLAGLLKTMYDNRTVLARQVATELDRHFGSKVFRTVIPRNVRLAEAPSYGVPVIMHDPSCTGAQSYRALAREFLARRP